MDESTANFTDEIRRLLNEYFVQVAELRLRSAARQRQPIAELFRRLHTIKGSAQTIKLNNITRVAHAAEELLAHIREGGVQITPNVLSALEQAGQLISSELDQPNNKEVIESTVTLLCDLADFQTPLPTIEFAPIGSRLPLEIAQGLNSSQKSQILAGLHSGGNLFMISTTFDIADFERNFMRMRNCLDHAGAEVVASYPRVNELDPNQIDFRLLVAGRFSARQISEATDPLDLKIESIWSPAELETADEKGSIAAPVKLRDLLERARRVGEVAATDEGKVVSFALEAEDLTVNALVAAKLNEALLHLMRNAVAHGIEHQPERIDAGKAAVGEIRLTGIVERDCLVIRVSDDGRGIEPERINQAAVIRKLITNGTELSFEQCVSLLFEPGFTTSDAAGATAGRGIGLDSVQSSTQSMRGEILVSSEAGKGSVFELRLPLTAD